MKMVDPEHKRNKEKKVVFIPRTNHLYVIVYKINREEGAKIKEKVHEEEQREACPKTDSDRNTC